MPLIIGGNRQASTGYTLDQSIRFNDDDSAYMQRVLSSGNRRLITLSLWLKLGNASTYGIFGTDTSNASGRLNNRIYISDGHFTHVQVDSSGNNLCNFKSLRKLRDVSAWYHLVLVIDTANALETERLRLYINGERETNFDNNSGGSFSCSQNLDTNFNNGEQHLIGALAYNNMGNIDSYFDGYMAEIHYLDGYGYGPEFFGEFNDSGIWIPKEYSGSYGTNGFKIDGRDSSDLGDDESGNGNDFTTSGLATHDQMADTPTNNHAVMNILDTNTTPNWTASNGNLDISWNGPNYSNHLFSTLSIPPTGKWYFEFKFISDSSQILYYQSLRIGLMRDDFNAAMVQTTYAGVNLTDSATDPEIYLVLGNAGNSCQLSGMGSTIYNVGGSISAGDVINFARNGANLWVGKNGTYYNSGNPATGSNPSLSNLELKSYRANMHWTSTSASHGTAVLHAFFGADKSIGSGTGFNDTVPTDFLALNTANLGS